LLLDIHSIIAEERITWIPASRELVVFATPAVQQSVAKAIDDCEQDALLFERLDLCGADPQLVDNIVRGAIRVQKIAKSQESSTGEFRFQLRSPAQCVDVWGRAAQIDFVKTTIEALGQQKPTIQQPPVEDDRVVRSSATTAAREDPISQRPRLLAPAGPIRLVPIKGADLLLIRGQRSDIERLFSD
jgi:hypothetical protein